MTLNGILQILLYIVVLTALAKPMGIYLVKIYNGEKTFLDLIFKPVERFFYAFCRVDPTAEMNWKQYGIAMLLFSLVSSLAVFAIQRLQFYLPYNPQAFNGPSSDSSFNTAVSFVTNTNWQGYVGESTMSYLTQMTALTVQNFVSAASGMAVLIALIRGLTRRTAHTIGNFWVDMTRSTLYILLPLSVILA